MPQPKLPTGPASLRQGLSTDVLVIGAGLNGLGVAWDASLRGLKVVVVEQTEICQGTTGRCQGLLQSGGAFAMLDPRSAADCVRENIILRRIAAGCIEDTGGFFLSTPADPVDYPDRWLSACRSSEILVEEIPVENARKLEPALSPRLSRAFRVNDAALDPCELSLRLVAAIREAGGLIYFHHRVSGLKREANKVVGAEIEDLRRGDRFVIGAGFVVNAAGPGARAVAKLADIDLPLTYTKRTMVAMASRPVHTIMNRCRPSSDGDTIVPSGSVIVLGTAEERVQDPSDLAVPPWGVDLLLAEAEFILPGMRQARALRAWAGIYASFDAAISDPPTPLNRGLIDHATLSSCTGFASLVGGSLTTFRLLAEQTVDLICSHLERPTPCPTRSAVLTPGAAGYAYLPSRLERSSSLGDPSIPGFVCECEFIDAELILRALDIPENLGLEALRRVLHLGMGPCQSGICALRTYALLAERTPAAEEAQGRIQPFLEERWNDQRPVGWGHALRQMELSRRLYQEFLGINEDAPA